MKLPTIRRIPDDLWLEIAPILGEEKKRPRTRGRAPVPFRKVLDGILYVLRTGCQWKRLFQGNTAQARHVTEGSSSGSRKEGRFEKIWIKLLQRYDDVRGIKWKWQSLDSSSVKAPLGGIRPVQTPLIGASSGPSGTY